MNRLTPQTINTVNAATYFGEYLRSKCISKRKTKELAEAIGIERKSIIAYAQGKTSPKLDIVAKVYAYYGESEIRIPI